MQENFSAQNARKVTNERVRLELEYFKSMGFHPELDEQLFSLVNRRFGGTPLRAFFVAQMHTYICENRLSIRNKLKQQSGDHKLFTTQLPFIFELIISIQYLHNQVLDQKAEVNTPEKVNQNLLHANLLKDLLYDYIDREFSGITADLIRQYTRKAFQLVDLGQYLEKRWNTIEHFEASVDIPDYRLSADIEQQIDLSPINPFIDHIRKVIPRTHWEFADLYLKRIYLTCAALFVLATDLLLALTKTKGKVAIQARAFAVSYGMMRQLVNDNADLIPSQFELTTNAKNVEDAFSDVKNGNVTLPILLHLCKIPNSELEQALYSGHQDWKVEEEPALYESILESHALYQSIQGSKLLAALCRQFLKGQGSARQLLLDTCEIVHWNKFLYPCLRSAQYKRFKKTSFYKHTKVLIRQVEKQAVEDKNPAYNGLGDLIFRFLLKSGQKLGIAYRKNYY